MYVLHGVYVLHSLCQYIPTTVDIYCLSSWNRPRRIFPVWLNSYFLSLSLLPFFFPLMNIDFLYSGLSAEDIEKHHMFPVIRDLRAFLVREDRHTAPCNKRVKSYKNRYKKEWGVSERVIHSTWEFHKGCSSEEVISKLNIKDKKFSRSRRKRR